jgi:magnesium transporter
MKDTHCEITEFNESSYKNYSPVSVEDILGKVQSHPKTSSTIKWIHFDGLTLNYSKEKQDFLDKLKEKFKLHSLTIEDLVNGEQRSKHEAFIHYDAIFTEIIEVEKESLKKSQFSILFNDTTVLSFSESSVQVSKIIQTLKYKFEDSTNRIRRKGSDYLVYMLVDSVIDSYFPIIENIELRVEKTDDEMIKNPDHHVLQKVHLLKKDILIIKKVISPSSEMIKSMRKGESKFFKEENFVFTRDLYDHIVRISETTENLRDIVYGLIDLYVSSTGLKMNEAMKVLTIISTIFVPITFITSIYGMNFDGMTELHAPYAYKIVLTIMTIISVSFLVWFRKKKWL